jgi:hypothetical protein
MTATLKNVYFLILSALIGLIPVPACPKNMKITNKNKPLIMATQTKLIYQLELTINIGVPSPE